MASVLAPSPAMTVQTNHTYAVKVTGRGFLSVDRAFFELRRHLSNTGEFPPIALVGGFGAMRIGRPVRAWSTNELAAMLAAIPAIQTDAKAGWPITLSVILADDATSVADQLRDAGRTAQSAGNSVLTRAQQAAADLANAAGKGVAIGAGLYLLYIAIGVAVLWFFRKPLLKLVSGGAA